MATWNDITRELFGSSEKIADRVAYRQSGVDPGFDPDTGITWTEDGRARYRSRGGNVRVMSFALAPQSGPVDLPVGVLMRRRPGTYGAIVGVVTPDFCELYTHVATPNDGSNYWTVQVVGYQVPGVGAGTIADIDTSADTAGTWTDHSDLPVAATTYPVVRCTLSKTGSPGAISLTCAVSYRLQV